jgi:hypothetical protein
MQRTKTGAGSAGADTERLGGITVDEFAEAAFRGIMRAIDARKLPGSLGRFPGPIVWGLIWWPQSPFEGEPNVVQPSRADFEGSSRPSR